MISRLLTLITSPSVFVFPVCAICCNLDSQITPSTEDLQASTNWDGLPHVVEVVNHLSFGSYKTKQVKSSINQSKSNHQLTQESCMIAKTTPDFTFAFLEAIPIIVMIACINSNKKHYSSSETTVGFTSWLAEYFWKQLQYKKENCSLLKRG